ANNAQAKSMEKLSSGQRINNAADDAAGLAISEKMRGQIRGLDQASRNAQDGMSMIQTAEGALNESTDILQRMRELAVQSSNDTNTDDDRNEIQKEMNQLKQEVTRISTDTEFNTKKLLNGDMGKQFTPTTSDLVTNDLQAVGENLGNGTYTLTLTDAGTDTFTVDNNSLNAGFDQDSISVASGAQIDYGSYRLEVSNYNSVGSTADFKLTGPDGKETTLAGQATNSDLTIGGLSLNLDTDNITKDGVMNFTLSSNGLEIDLTGASTVNTSPISAYTGGKLNIGGFEFSLKTNHGSDDDTLVGTLQDKSVKLQIGANQDQNTSLSINDMSATSLGINDVDVTSQTGANTAIDTISKAIVKVSGERSKLGASQNRLDHTINNLSTSSENLTAAESR
ncbi:flagellin, partial [Priestia sp. BR_2]